MKCLFCSEVASFICRCSDQMLCSYHFGEHLQRNESHHYQTIKDFLYTSERLNLLNDLTKKITLLKEIKNKLFHDTEQIITKICEMNLSAISKIDEKIKFFKTFTKDEKMIKSQIEDLKKILNAEMNINYPDLTEFLDQIKKFYSGKILDFNEDPEKNLVQLTNQFYENHSGIMTCLAVSSDESLLMTGSMDTSVRLWDLKNKRQVACYLEHRGTVSSVAFYQNGLLAISGSYDKSIIVWDIKKGLPHKSLHGHRGKILCIILSNDENFIISGSVTNEIFLWSIEVEEPIGVISMNKPVKSILITFNNELYVACTKTIHIVNLSTFQTDYSKKAHEGNINCITATKSSQFIITGSSDKTISLWFGVSLDSYAVLTGHKEEVLSVSVTPDDMRLVSGSIDESIILWSIDSKSMIHKFIHHSEAINGVTIIQDSLFSVSSDFTIGKAKISELTSELLFTPLEVNNLSEFYKNNKVAYGSFNDVVLWDSQKNTQTVFEGHSYRVNAVILYSHAKFMISSSNGVISNLIHWDIDTKEPFYLDGHDSSVLCIDISDDETFFLSGDKKGSVIYWDIPSLTKGHTFEGHIGSVNSVKISKNKLYAVTGGSDNNVCIWDIKNIFQVVCFQDHRFSIEKVLFTSDDNFAVSVSKFEELFVWDLSGKKNEFCFLSYEDSKSWLDSNEDVKLQLIRYYF